MDRIDLTELGLSQVRRARRRRMDMSALIQAWIPSIERLAAT